MVLYQKETQTVKCIDRKVEEGEGRRSDMGARAGWPRAETMDHNILRQPNPAAPGSN